MARSDWSRRFPPPWSVEEMNSACFIVKDNNGQALAYVYFESDAGGRTAANRSFKVHPISAPSSHERGKHYLQRFWEKLPEHGQIVVFDRSWYGRVLVERVEGFAATREWRRGYEEINQFERLLVEDGIRIVKIFLHISAGEQMRRFKDRVTNPAQAVEALLRGLPQPGAMGGLRSRDRRYDGTNIDQMGALVSGASERQIVWTACRIQNPHCSLG